jgi:hypothetical protein
MDIPERGLASGKALRVAIRHLTVISDTKTYNDIFAKKDGGEE